MKDYMKLLTLLLLSSLSLTAKAELTVSESIDSIVELESITTSSNIYNAKASKWVQTNDPRIMSLSDSIVAGIEGEYEKVLAIDDWITSNIVYNKTSTMFSQKIDAITTLEMKMGICTGYSNLFAALARASGLETKVMTGKAKNFDGRTYYHQWNEVKIDGTWYFIDTTWNAGLHKRVFFTKVSEYPATHKRPKEVRSY